MTLTALDFPSSPVVGDLYPDPPVTGQPQYMWNGTQWLASKAAVTQIARTDALGWSGMQINGSMDVSQELGTTGRTTIGYVCDGWQTVFVGTGITVNAVADRASGVLGIPGRIYATNTAAKASLAAGDYIFLKHPIEGYRCMRLSFGNAAAKPVTIAFWSGHSIPGTYTVSVQNSVPNRTYAATYTHNVGLAWEYKTITIPGDMTGGWDIENGAGINLIFTMACGTTYTAPSANVWIAGNYLAAPGQVNAAATSGNYMAITGVVVLPGIEAPTAAQSPLIMRPYDQELVTCRRYFQQIGGTMTNEVIGLGQAYATTAAQVNTFFDTPMRAAPVLNGVVGTFCVLNSAAAPIATTGMTQIAASTSQSVINISVASGLTPGNATKLTANNDLTARVRFDARL